MVITACRIMTIIAISQLVLLSISVFKRKDTRNSKLLLVILLLSFCLFLTGNFALLFKVNRSILNFAHIFNLIIFLSAPLLYLFVSQRIDSNRTIKKTYILHFIPFTIVLFHMILKIFFLDEKVFAYTNSGIWLISLLFIQNIIYFIAIQQKLKDVGISIFKKSPGNSSVEVEWLRKLFILFSSILVVQLFIFIVCRLFFIMLLCVGAVGTSFILTFVLINNIILFGLSKPYVFELKEKYRNTPIKLDNKQAFLSQIKKAFEEEEVYLDPLLSLEKLSKKIGIPRNYLSQIINDYFSLNFNELINKYRIQKVTDKLKKEYTGDAIINIAYEVGFNAKSTFNTAFKKYTEMTPSQYLTQKSEQLEAS